MGQYFSSSNASINQKACNGLSKKCEESAALKAAKEARERINGIEKGIVKVTDRVYVARGYGMAECIVIQGKYSWQLPKSER